MRSKGAISLAEDGLRYRAEEATVLDSYGGGRVEVFPGSGGMDSLPAAFYGTVTAAVMTWRGGLAMHGSAVEMDGRGALLCGHSGAGKSTLTGALIAAGARLVSDDLSVLHTGPAGNDPVLFAGRRTLRLFPDVADRLGKAVAVKEVPAAAEAKRLVAPPRVEAGRAVPLSAILVLGEAAAPAGHGAATQLLLPHFYRPRAFCVIPVPGQAFSPDRGGGGCSGAGHAVRGGTR